MTTQPPTPDKLKALELLETLTTAQAAQAEEIKYLLDSVSQLLDLVHPITEAMSKIQNALTHPQQTQVTTTNQKTPIDYITFTATEITLTYNDKGQPVTRFKGDRYCKFGVMCWPETLSTLGYTIDQLKPGPNPITPRQVTAILNDNGQPKKIISAPPPTPTTNTPPF